MNSIFRRPLACILLASGIAANLHGGPAHADAPPGHYSLLTADTEVKDTRTGLIWARSEEAGTFSWVNAKSRCSSKGGGYRLPTYRELLTLVDETTSTAPTIDKTAFPGTTAGSFWSSTPFALSTGQAITIGFGTGATDVLDVGSAYRVRCVR